jgi:hypothetical protein
LFDKGGDQNNVIALRTVKLTAVQLFKCLVFIQIILYPASMYEYPYVEPWRTNLPDDGIRSHLPVAWDSLAFYGVQDPWSGSEALRIQAGKGNGRAASLMQQRELNMRFDVQ